MVDSTEKNEGDKIAHLSSDRAGKDPAADRLGRAPLAQYLAKSIVNLRSDNGLVIALYGAWGSGKTTTLNYILHFLNETQESQKPVILSFNPWWLSGDENLIRSFFGQLQAVLEEHGPIPAELRNRLADLAEAVSKIPVPFAAWAGLAEPLLRAGMKDVPSLKEEIARLLSEAGRRILVVIDDIDRLAREEIKQTFRMIKGVADFPNVTYLIAFDRGVVSRALADLQGEPGDDYLRKIVQVEFELPLPDRLSLRSMFFERLNTILSGVTPEAFDQKYWGNVFYDGIDAFLDTPRDVTRLANALAVTFPAVCGEVNPVDFIAIETLRLFCADIYDKIRANKEMFAGGAPEQLTRPTNDELLKFHNGWLEPLQKRDERHAEAVRDMLSRLFPGKLRAIWANTSYGADWQERWGRDLRVCSEDVFPVYFALAVPEGEISNTEMQAILEDADEPGAFSEVLLRLVQEVRPDGKTKASVFLDKLQDFTRDRIPIECVQPILESIFGIGDQLIIPGDGARGFFDLGNEFQTGRIVWQLLGRLEQDQRFAVLQNTFSSGSAIYQMWHTVILLGQQQGKYTKQGASPESEWLVTQDQLTALEEILVQKIRAASSDGSLLNTPRLHPVLNFWAEKVSDEEVKAWVGAATENNTDLVRFIESYLQTGATYSFGNKVSSKVDRLDPEWIRRFLDPNETAMRIGEILKQPESLTERQQRALRRYLEEYEIRASGRNPEDPFLYANE